MQKLNKKNYIHNLELLISRNFFFFFLYSLLQKKKIELGSSSFGTSMHYLVHHPEFGNALFEVTNQVDRLESIWHSIVLY